MPAKKKTPAAAEATGQLIPFDFEGRTYHVLPTSEWPVEALEAFEDGKVTGFLRAVLAPGAWDDFKATGPKVNGLAQFVEAIQAAVGVSGN